ncbi:MAG: hypothetical protein K9M07_04110 [Simkaniaceae bacterium]|nr:hypothetical protein [Simkaniaceae bacterium]MCF7852412.1 hypothetical protein [Simkaniaceae bacterium]
MNKYNLPLSLLKHTPWDSNLTPIWPASTFILQRNLANMLFPEHLSTTELSHVKNIIRTVLLKSKILINPVFLDADCLSQNDRDFLHEHFFTLPEMKSFGAGQGFCIDETNSILISVNFIDHLCIHIKDSSSKWEESFQKLMALDQELNSLLKFAYSEQFGFLTADPTQCGTGLIIESLLHLPLLLHLKKPIDIMNHMDNGIMLSSLSRNLDFTGDIGMIQNIYTLGISEDQILDLLHTNALKLMHLERELQSKLVEKPSTQIKDRISRAIGSLTNNYQIDAKEALSSLSQIKLGIQLGWVTGIDLNKIHHLFFQVQRAHLLYAMDAPNDLSELKEHRSSFLKETLKDLSITI